MLQIQVVSLNFCSLSFKMTVDTHAVPTMPTNRRSFEGQTYDFSASHSPGAAKGLPDSGGKASRYWVSLLGLFTGGGLHITSNPGPDRRESPAFRASAILTFF